MTGTIGNGARAGRRGLKAGVRTRLLPAVLASIGLFIATGAFALDDNRLFARLTTQRGAPYAQEIFDITLTVYSQGLNMGREVVLLELDVPGLNVFPFQDRGIGRETVDGRIFEVHRFLGHAQAAAAGTFMLRPAVQTSVVVPRTGGAEIQEVVLRPPLLSVDVRPLPAAGKPAGFTGAVGRFTFAAAIKPAAVAGGAPVTLTMEISGQGNLESVAAPRLPAGDRFKSYEPKLIGKEIGADQSRGRLVFEQVIIPDAAGSMKLPPVTFSYFDPARKSYQEIGAGPFPLSVSAAAGPAAVALEPTSPRSAARNPLPGPDVAPLKPEPRDWAALPAPLWRLPPGLLALQLVPLGLALALFFGARRREERARDVGKTRRQLAPSAARAGIAAAEQALLQGDPARFHDALWQALSSYFGHRLNLLPGEISGEQVARRLSPAGLDPGAVLRLGEIFLLCEQERFSGPSNDAAPLSAKERQRLASVLNELGRLLEACEKVVL